MIYLRLKNILQINRRKILHCIIVLYLFTKTKIGKKVVLHAIRLISVWTYAIWCIFERKLFNFGSSGICLKVRLEPGLARTCNKHHRVDVNTFEDELLEGNYFSDGVWRAFSSYVAGEIVNVVERNQTGRVKGILRFRLELVFRYVGFFKTSAVFLRYDSV